MYLNETIRYYHKSGLEKRKKIIVCHSLDHISSPIHRKDQFHHISLPDFLPFLLFMILFLLLLGFMFAEHFEPFFLQCCLLLQEITDKGKGCTCRAVKLFGGLMFGLGNSVRWLGLGSGRCLELGIHWG